MLGAIVGDIVGSIYEFNNIQAKDFELFGKGCEFTDDTVMTVAVGEALMNGGTPDNFIDSMKKYGRMYPDADYGCRFGQWIFTDSREPYNSYGNGSAMRVSPCAWYARTLEQAEALAETSAAVTHNHPDGIKGAKATAAAIFLARRKCTPAQIRSYIEGSFGYDLSNTLDEIRPKYFFNETCKDTVPQAITAFLESVSFEDAIRNAVSLGGDSDTLAAITGGIAEAYYGIDESIGRETLSYLDDTLNTAVRTWYDWLKRV